MEKSIYVPKLIVFCSVGFVTFDRVTDSAEPLFLADLRTMSIVEGREVKDFFVIQVQRR